MLAATKVKMSGSEKKSEQDHNISSINRVTRKLLEVSRCRYAKQRQRNDSTKKSVLHVQSCFLLLIRPSGFLRFYILFQ